VLYFVCHYTTRVVLRSSAGCVTGPVGVVLAQQRTAVNRIIAATIPLYFEKDYYLSKN
jgi:hypothetical protein